MRYISEVDNKVFNTEQECLEHENTIRKSMEEELKKKEKLKMEQQSRLNEIYKKDEELRKLIESYRKDYGGYSELYYHSPLVELLQSILGEMV